jgi:hypothetical protein
VARLACPEALYGVAYTPDEMYEDRPSSGGLGAVLAEPVDVSDAEIVEAAEDGPNFPEGGAES